MQFLQAFLMHFICITHALAWPLASLKSIVKIEFQLPLPPKIKHSKGGLLECRIFQTTEHYKIQCIYFHTQWFLGSVFKVLSIRSSCAYFQKGVDEIWKEDPVIKYDFKLMFCFNLKESPVKSYISTMDSFWPFLIW